MSSQFLTTALMVTALMTRTKPATTAAVVAIPRPVSEPPERRIARPATTARISPVSVSTTGTNSPATAVTRAMMARPETRGARRTGGGAPQPGGGGWPQPPGGGACCPGAGPAPGGGAHLGGGADRSGGAHCGSGAPWPPGAGGVPGAGSPGGRGRVPPGSTSIAFVLFDRSLMLGVTWEASIHACRFPPDRPVARVPCG